MFIRPIPRNEEGASPGGGAPQPAAPASPAANQGATAAPSIEELVSKISAAVSSNVDQKMADFKNAVFADLRRSGALKSDKPSPTAPAPAPTPVEAPAAPSAPGGMTAAEVQTLMARERAFTRAVASASLTDRQLARMEETYRAVNPPDPAEWARGYLEDMGIGKANATPATPTPSDNNKPAQPQAAPVAASAPGPTFSDKGPAATSSARDPAAILQHRPTEATMDDFRRLSAQHGQLKALQMWTDQAMAYLQTVRVVPESKRQR